MAELQSLRRLPPFPVVPAASSTVRPFPLRFFSRSGPPPRPRILCPCERRSDDGGGGAAWGSNAEGVRRERFRFSDMKGGGSDGGPEEPEEEGGRWSGKRGWWWSDELYDGGEEDADLLDDEPEQPWDNIWIFKVFRAYGYLLPAIIASLLLASGPKAFLMALALPLGQSVLSLAVDKLWGSSAGGSGAGGRRQSRSRRKKQSDGGAAGFRRRSSEEEKGSGFRAREARRPWAAPEGESAASAQDYGGWDELSSLGGWTPGKGAVSRSPSQAAAPPPPVRKGKLSRRERGGEVPLLLRLLVAIFPFLGSWTKIL
ncbi:unnamed protein product [Spirodela intermedia]|uniref:Uncharacterized protein n=1 Tax=Spirodela intermedia TaxID=51605 RepID=A0A7I8K6V0_SPIIN|nr:unnamed protein product [Spirodela intermedia]